MAAAFIRRRATEPISGIGRGALAHCKFYCHRRVERMGGVSYLGVPSQYAPVAAMVVILPLGVLNYFGPKHSGSVSIWLAAPAVIVVLATIAFSIPHLNFAHLEPRHTNLETVGCSLSE